MYSFKQAPRAWFHHFSGFLQSHGFLCSHVDPSMFVAHTNSHISVLLLYVDDTVVTANSKAMLHRFISLLSEAICNERS